MKTLIKIIIFLAIAGFIIDLLSKLIVPILAVGAIWFGVRMFKKKKARKQIKQVKTIKEVKSQEERDSIEYKMSTLLEMAEFNPGDVTKRIAYRTKSQLNLLDLWYKYMDLRAKLYLNNTSTSREESVLHLMCDEVLSRIESAEVEITNDVRKEFILENVTPLLQDIIDIMEGIKPNNSISIDAYQLLNKSKGEQEPLLHQLAR